jgi:hypothetical protein
MRFAPLLLLAACVFHPEEVEERLVLEGDVTAAVVRGGTGDVRVSGDPTLTVAHVRWHATFIGDAPTVHAALEDGVLSVDVDCPSSPVCSVDLELAIPAGAAVDVDAGTGDLLLEDLSGELLVSGGTGDVTLTRISGPTMVDLGTGDVTGEALASPTSVSVGTGDVRLTLDVAAPTTVDGGTGDVSLVVPAGAYDLVLESGTGDISFAGVTDDPEAQVGLQVRVGTGDITVNGN